MTESEYLTLYPWTDPTTKDDVRKIKGEWHIAVSVGSTHKAALFMAPIHSRDLDHVDGLDWELFHVALEDDTYFWGSFVEGMGMFNVQVVKTHTRDLTAIEREIWSKKTLGMYGMNSGKLSYTLPSGVK